MPVAPLGLPEGGAVLESSLLASVGSTWYFSGNPWKTGRADATGAELGFRSYQSYIRPFSPKHTSYAPVNLQPGVVSGVNFPQLFEGKQ